MIDDDIYRKLEKLTLKFKKPEELIFLFGNNTDIFNNRRITERKNFWFWKP